MLTFEPFRIWCLKNKKKREEIVGETGINLNTVNQIYNDKFHFSTRTIELLCTTYHLRVEEVIEFREDGNEGN